MASTADKTFQVKFVSAVEQFEGSGYESFDFTPAEKSKGTGIDWADLDDGSSFSADAGETPPADGHLEVAFEGPTGADEQDNSDPTVAVHLDASAIATTQVLTDTDDTFHYDGRSSVAIDAGAGTDTIALDGASENYLIYSFWRGTLGGEVEPTLVIFDIETGYRIVSRGVEKLDFSDGSIDLPKDFSALAGSVIKAHPDTGTFEDINDSHLVANLTWDENGKTVTGPFWSVDWSAGNIADYAHSTATTLGTDQADRLSDTSGVDMLVGGAGDDIIVATASLDFQSDFLLGGAGNDSFFLGTGGADILGGDGDDTVYAVEQVYFQGNPVHPTFFFGGNQGHDTLQMGVTPEHVLLFMGGNPIVYGISIVNSSLETLGAVLSVESIAFTGGASIDLPTGMLELGYYSLVQKGTDWKLELIHTADWLPGSDTSDADRVFADDNGAVIDGGDGDDYLNGGAGADVISGGDGTDTLFGVMGNDTLLGGAGDDTLYGSPGDHLDGGDGTDDLFAAGTTATGGAGADQFDIVVNLYDGALTTITDFSVTEDRIHLTNQLAFLSENPDALTVTVQQTHEGTLLSVGQDHILIKGLSPDELVGAAIVDGFSGENLYPLS